MILGISLPPWTWGDLENLVYITEIAKICQNNGVKGVVIWESKQNRLKFTAKAPRIETP